jgi:transmembrane sensor
MNENSTNIDELLAKKLTNELTDKEAKNLEDWLAQSTENERYFADFQWLWLNVPHSHNVSTQAVDTEMALQKVHASLNKKPSSAKIIQMRFWVQSAAAAFVLAIAAFFFFQKNTPTVSQNFVAKNEILVDSLSDGSEMTLNTQSSLTILSDFNKKERRVRLTGEAFFNIAPNKEKPFVVEVQDLEVKVVGTSFNVDEKSNIGTIKVTVKEGKVLLQSKIQNEYLVAGEEADYEKATGRITRLQQPTSNVLAYKNRLFVFDAMPLSAVIQQLNKVYGVEIVLKNANLANCPLSARYDNLSIERIADLIAETFSFKIEHLNNKVYLDGKACAE